jgi:hypothetical protein
MKIRKTTIILVLLALISLPIAVPMAIFIGEAISFGIRLSIKEGDARSMKPEVAQKIIKDARTFADLYAKENQHFDFRTNDLKNIDLPASIKELEPRRIAGQKDHIMISLLFMMDTGGELYVSKGTDEVWILEGRFGEREPSFRIYPNEKRAF